MWPIAANKAGKLYREVLEVTEQFMVRWYEHEAKRGRRRHASNVGDEHGKGKGGGQ